MIKLFVPHGENIPFPLYIQEGLVKVVNQKPNIYTTIEKNICACNTVNDIAVYETSIFVKSIDQYVNGSSCYRVAAHTETEFLTCVLWLVKSRFYTFHVSKVEYLRERTGKPQKTLVRKLTPFFFHSEILPCECLKFTMFKTPVYCLKNVVLAGKKKGPTINSVI